MPTSRNRAYTVPHRLTISQANRSNRPAPRPSIGLPRRLTDLYRPSMRGWIREGWRLALIVWVAMLAGSPAATAGGTVLYRGNGSEPETLDVHRSTGTPEFDLQVGLFEGLVHYGPAARTSSRR